MAKYLSGVYHRNPSDRMPQSEQFPALSTCFFGYFNQDWRLDYGDWMAAVADFLRKEPLTWARKTLDELDHLMQLKLDDCELFRVTALWGNYYDPRPSGMTTAQWIRSMRDCIDDFIQKPRDQERTGGHVTDDSPNSCPP